MKRIFLLIAVAIGLAAASAEAQQQPVRYNKQPYNYNNNTPGQLRFGIRAGVNFSDWDGETMQSVQDLVDMADGYATQEMRTGFHAGGYVTIPVTPGFEIEPGLQYSQKGMVLRGKLPVEEVDFLNANVTLTNKSEYLDLPVLAKVYVGEGFHFFAGPQVSYLLSNKVSAEAGALGFKALNQEWDMKSGFSEFDAAVTGGVGYKFANGFNISAGYDYGLNPIDSKGNFETYNRVIKASVGLTF
ncbi:porin family protein [Pontibacter mangrovi]|uniref:PorT family protein n=1 Tax=Pontibacter mangrovi TaxID=2589816 RepID=A0A501W1D0_9BACT|nr:porin family protein [Pontibacter mangrovi]TPE43088.1 PorT family protein [Pontibacter mangrovi]